MNTRVKLYLQGGNHKSGFFGCSIRGYSEHTTLKSVLQNIKTTTPIQVHRKNGATCRGRGMNADEP